jgi:hypothetical protein
MKLRSFIACLSISQGMRGMKEAQAVPDKGSNKNVMSLAYAHALGYPVEGGQHSRVTVKLANGAIIQSHGSIETQFKFRRMVGQPIQCEVGSSSSTGIPSTWQLEIPSSRNTECSTRESLIYNGLIRTKRICSFVQLMVLVSVVEVLSDPDSTIASG